MKKTTVILLVVTVLVAGGAGLLVTRSARAENDFGKPFDSLVQKIADQFGLNQDEVQVVFDEHQAERRAEREKRREERQAEREQKFAEKLTEAVNNGEITEEQKQLILAKRAELENQNQAQKQNMEQKRLELEAWAEENGLENTGYLLGGFGQKFGGPGGPKGTGPAGDCPW